jgi:hypothetical protein
LAQPLVTETAKPHPFQYVRFYRTRQAESWIKR